jgi:MoaA/NifB/PqqE/SkfB family radical SAM enzyme
MTRLEDTLSLLDINLGDACNLRCVHCPCWINESAPRFDPGVLERRLTEAVEYVTSECRVFDKTMLIGGEPMIHEGVARFLANQRLDDAYLCMYTNFAWPDPTVEFPDNVRFLASLDAATNEVYVQLRRSRFFARHQELLKRHAGKLIHVDTTVSKGNVHQLDAIRDITEPYETTHWLLPIDPRVLRYANRSDDGHGFASERERGNARRTANRVQSILLDDDDLEIVRDFLDRRGADKMNDFANFEGIYLSGIDHFKRDEFEYHNGVDVALPAVGDTRCAGIRRYMEISFTADGRFLPMVHCPEVRATLGIEVGPPMDSFEQLMEWENEVRAPAACETFCARTQFLGLDEYQQTFQRVATV